MYRLSLSISDRSDAAKPSPAVIACLSPAGRVESWVLCTGCRYRLFGLMPDRSCPECGSPIGLSIRPSRVRSLSSRGLRTVRSSADSMRVAATLAVLAGASAFVQVWLAAILAVSAMVALCIGAIGLDAPAIGGRPRSFGRFGSVAQFRSGLESPAAAILTAVAGAPICLFLAWMLFFPTPRGGFSIVEWKEAVGTTLALLLAGLAAALLVQPVVVWLRRVGELFADSGNVVLVDNAMDVASLMRCVQLIAIVATPIAPLLPPIGFVAAMAGVPFILTALGVLLRVLIAIRREVSAALPESALRDGDAF